MRKRKSFFKEIAYEMKKSQGIGSGSVFIVVIFIAMSFFGFALAGGEVPSIRGTQPPKENAPVNTPQATPPPVTNNPSIQQQARDADISTYPSPTRKIIYLP